MALERVAATAYANKSAVDPRTNAMSSGRRASSLSAAFLLVLSVGVLNRHWISPQAGKFLAAACQYF
eukprot:s2086_g10.t1